MRLHRGTFFAAGACHILASAFLEAYPAAGFSPIGLRRVGQPYAGHVYVSDGTRAFDHDGWNDEGELLVATRVAHSERDPHARIERLALTGDIEAFCAEHNSRLPSEYAFDPWPRAHAYIARLDPPFGSGTIGSSPDPSTS